MTKFSTEFIDKVKTHWQENKGKVKYVAETGVHLRRKTSKKYTLDDVVTILVLQKAKQGVFHVKPTKPKEHIQRYKHTSASVFTSLF